MPAQAACISGMLCKEFPLTTDCLRQSASSQVGCTWVGHYSIFATVMYKAPHLQGLHAQQGNISLHTLQHNCLITGTSPEHSVSTRDPISSHATEVIFLLFLKHLAVAHQAENPICSKLNSHPWRVTIVQYLVVY